MATPLEALADVLAYRVDDELEAPEPRLGDAHRVRVRSLNAMQKEALVTDGRSGRTWRLSSDEGPYLDGTDVAPPPLAYFVAGASSAYTSELLAEADRRGVAIDDVEVAVDTYYAIDGSLLQGTMRGTAFTPDVAVTVDAPADRKALESIVDAAVRGAPVAGFLSAPLTSRFRLGHNGTQLEPEGVEAREGDLGPDPAALFEDLAPAGPAPDRAHVRHTGRTTEPLPEADEKYTEGDAAGYADEQDRKIHLRATCTPHDDGVLHVEQELFSPRGTVFEFHADEPPGRGGEGRAPDPMSYVTTGIGLCFMTQFGRYAHAVKEELTGYRVVQDTHVSASRARGGVDEPARALPVEADVFLDTPGDADFARSALRMSEQTCYLHSMCRTPDLDPAVELTVT